MLHLEIGQELIHKTVPMRLLYRIKSVRDGELWCVRRIMTEYPWDHDEFFNNHEHVRLLHTRTMRVGGSNS